MGNFVGIDLGTTFSLLSVFKEDGTSEIIYDELRFLPSVVYFGESETVFGDGAINAAEMLEDNVVFQIKKKMPQNLKYSLSFNNSKYSPEDISSLILRKLISDAEIKIGKIDTATITVPAFYNDIAREATRNAALKAGIINPTIINEPVSAALYYSRTKNTNGKVLIYDLGGGTLDCSVAEINGDNVKILANRGDSFGGSDFNEKLFDLINQAYIKEKGVPISSNLEKSRMANYLKIELYKKLLDKQSEIKVSIDGDNGNYQFSILSSDFHNKIEEYILKSEMIIETLLEELKLDKSEIDEVLLVGGSTRLPLIQDHLKKTLNKDKLNTTANVDEIVCLGASINCALRNQDDQSPEQKTNLGDANLSDVVNKYYGTRILNQAMNKRVNMVMINKNDSYPTSYTHVFETVSDNSRLSCILTESEISTEDLNFTEIIGETLLDDLGSGRGPGMPIEVTFTVNRDMILKCSYKDIKTGKEVFLDTDLNVVE